LRLGETRELARSEILDLEERADLSPRTVSNHERARLGQRLQPGGEVRGLADHSALLGRARTDQISDHDKAAGDTEPYAQRFRCGQRADCGNDGEPRPHRPFGVVLMRLRIAEIDQHPVTHVLGDKAGAPGDGLGNAAVVGADQLPQILRIKPRRQRRRADEIAKHHRQLAAFGIGGSQCINGRRRYSSGGHRGAERSDSVEDSAAVADRHDAELTQILGRQPPQHLPVNVVLAERGRVLFEPEAAQPFRYIDRHRVSLFPERRRPPEPMACHALVIQPEHVGARRAVSDDRFIPGQQGEMLGARLRNQHAVERIAMPTRQGDQRSAVIGSRSKPSGTANRRGSRARRSSAIKIAISQRLIALT